MASTDGGWSLDPDTQVRERLHYVFDSFRCHGVVRAVVRDLKERRGQRAQLQQPMPVEIRARQP
jgi:hypothetical protein